MNEQYKLKKIFLSLFHFFLVFFILSLFFSFDKIYIPLILALTTLFFNQKIKKIISINILVLTFSLKIIFLLFSPEDYYATLSKTIYEKDYLYGVKNIELKENIFGGNLNPNDKSKAKIVNISTDKYGFRNTIDFKDSDFILIGDSMLHNHRIDDNNLINNILNKSQTLKFYNAALSSTDVGHYLETIRFFKENNYEKQFIAFFFTGNDFLNYEKVQKNYSDKLNNLIYRNYFEIKEFFDFFTKIKFVIQFFKKNELSDRVDKNKVINNEKVYFYKSYYIKPDQNLNLSKKFDFYKNYSPDIIVIIPTKAQVYCKYIQDYNCPNINYESVLKINKIFENSLILDSTKYLTDNAEIFLNSNKFIYEKEDTHLNELGLNILSKFLLKNLNS